MRQCSVILFSLTALVALASAAPPTFNQDIAPILYANCATCHRPGEVAPFPLLTYQDASKRASLIAGAVGGRFMPPMPHMSTRFDGVRHCVGLGRPNPHRFDGVIARLQHFEHVVRHF